jgi:hypothetical protein
MKLWVLHGTYESEMFTSIHLTEKGCALAAIADVLDFFHIDSDEEAVRVISESYAHRDTDVKDIEPFHWNYEILKDMTSKQLWKIFGDWTETCWEQMSDRSYYIDATPQMVQA